MKQGDSATVKVGDQILQGTYLGRGRHAKAFRVRVGGPFPDTVFLLVDDDDSMKECLARWCRDLPHLPTIKECDRSVRSRNGKYYNLYAMPFYPNVRAAHKEAWAVLKTLYESRERLLSAKYRSNPWAQDDYRPLWLHGAYLMDDVIEDTRGRVPETVTAALTELMNAGCNYGAGVTFEFGKRNVGVDEQERVVFRDILFDAEKIHREIMKRRG